MLRQNAVTDRRRSRPDTVVGEEDVTEMNKRLRLLGEKTLRESRNQIMRFPYSTG